MIYATRFTGLGSLYQPCIKGTTILEEAISIFSVVIEVKCFDAFLPSLDFRNSIEYSLRLFFYYFKDFVSFRYTRLNLDEFRKTQKTMDKYVNGIVGGEKALIFVGSSSFSPSSSIRRCVRCPGLKRLLGYLCLELEKTQCMSIDTHEKYSQWILQPFNKFGAFRTNVVRSSSVGNTWKPPTPFGSLKNSLLGQYNQ